MINQINLAIEESGLNVFGLRVMTGGQVVSIGEALSNSFDWVDGVIDTESQLDGTCALDLEFDGWEVSEDRVSKMLEMATIYNSEDFQVVVIGGNESYEGNDCNEIVISDAVCVYVIK